MARRVLDIPIVLGNSRIAQAWEGQNLLLLETLTPHWLGFMPCCMCGLYVYQGPMMMTSMVLVIHWAGSEGC
jgi:hypothetical protein